MSEKLISADRLKQVLDKNFGHTGGAAVLEQLIDIAPAVDAVEVDKVAQMFFDFTGDDCPCNYVGVDEWLPEVCELQKECPRPADRLGCWKQFIKHYGERREENAVD